MNLTLKQVAEGHAEYFIALGKAGIMDRSQANRLNTKAGFRNRLVHAYRDMDYDQVDDIIINAERFVPSLTFIC